MGCLQSPLEENAGSVEVANVSNLAEPIIFRRLSERAAEALRGLQSTSPIEGDFCTYFSLARSPSDQKHLSIATGTSSLVAD